MGFKEWFHKELLDCEGDIKLDRTSRFLWFRKCWRAAQKEEAKNYEQTAQNKRGE